jgi:CubicO group peptidase (beta-lactamase class C family)
VSPDTLIQGTLSDSYGEVRDAFRANFDSGAEAGAAVCVYRSGKPVVDLWAGVAAPSTGRLWQRSTLAVLASPTKALTVGPVLQLADRGILDLDRPIASYWRNFGRNGKEEITMRMVLSHRSGIVCLDHEPISIQGLRDHLPIVHALENAHPEWVPGAAFGYHATTFGHLASEVIRRITGLTAGQYFASEIAQPLSLDAYIGLRGQSVDLAEMTESKAEALMNGADPGEIEELRNPTTLTFRATLGSMSSDPADPHVEEPSYGGLASAHALARYIAAYITPVDGTRIIGDGMLAEAMRPHSTGTCLVMLSPCSWGLGFQVPDSAVFPANAGLTSAFGLSGANGVFVFADPVHDIAFGYVPNMGSAVMGSMDHRVRRLVEATYRAVASTTRMG